MRTRRQRQIEVEAPFTLPSEQQARVFSFMDVRSVVSGAAVACKRWRAIIATDVVAWTTAMSELDPCAVLGPAGVKAAAQQLQRIGGWLALAHRLGNRRCGACTGCDSTCALWFDTARLRRVCSCQ
jgi:F-box-like